MRIASGGFAAPSLKIVLIQKLQFAIGRVLGEFRRPCESKCIKQRRSRSNKHKYSLNCAQSVRRLQYFFFNNKRGGVALVDTVALRRRLCGAALALRPRGEMETDGSLRLTARTLQLLDFQPESFCD